MSDVDWFLKYQHEAKAYRVTKVRIPKLKYTLLRDSLQMGQEVRRFHVCSENLFLEGVEELRIKDPFIGLDLVMIHGDMTFEGIFETLQVLRRSDPRPFEMTIDLSKCIANLSLENIREGVKGFFQMCDVLEKIKISFTTVQFDPIDMDLVVFLANANRVIIEENMARNVFTPYLHRSTMSAKKGLVNYRFNLWKKNGVLLNFSLEHKAYIYRFAACHLVSMISGFRLDKR